MSETVHILLFASAREAVGRGELHRKVPAEGLSLAELLDELARAYSKLGRVLAVSRYFVNGAAVPGRTGRLRPGDELAVHPPYSGG